MAKKKPPPARRKASRTSTPGRKVSGRKPNAPRKPSRTSTSRKPPATSRKAARPAGDRKPRRRRRRVYERHVEAVNRREKIRTKKTQDIGPIPPPKDPERRAAALARLQVYCETYFPAKFYLGFSADHLKAIARLEEI